MAFVVDASVTLTWLFEDESIPAAEQLQDRLTAEDWATAIEQAGEHGIGGDVVAVIRVVAAQQLEKAGPDQRQARNLRNSGRRHR